MLKLFGFRYILTYNSLFWNFVAFMLLCRHVSTSTFNSQTFLNNTANEKDYKTKTPDIIKLKVTLFLESLSSLHHSYYLESFNHSDGIKNLTRFINQNATNSNIIHIRISGSGIYPMTLQLKQSRPIISAGFVVRFSNKSKPVKNFQKLIQDGCHFTGKVLEYTNSHVSVNLCNKVTGKIKLFEEAAITSATFHKNYWNATMEVLHESNPDFTKVKNRTKRQVDSYLVKTNWLKTGTVFYIEVFLVIDKGTYKKQGRSVDNCFQTAQKLIHGSNVLMTKIGLYLVLVGIEIWDGENRIEMSQNNTQTLANFNEYQYKYLYNSGAYDTVVLLSDKLVNFPKNGITNIGHICTAQSSGIILNAKKDLKLSSASLAHQLGNLLGLADIQADERDDCDCPRKRTSKCVMESEGCK